MMSCGHLWGLLRPSLVWSVWIINQDGRLLPEFLIKPFLSFLTVFPDNKYSTPLLLLTAALLVWADFTYLAVSILEIIKQMTADELYLTV